MWSISFTSSSARLINSRTATFPSSTADSFWNTVLERAKGVRHPSTIATLRPIPFIAPPP